MKWHVINVYHNFINIISTHHMLWMYSDYFETGRDRMVVGFTTTYAIGAYRH